jgi:hypothetical protein
MTRKALLVCPLLLAVACNKPSASADPSPAGGAVQGPAARSADPAGSAAGAAPAGSAASADGFKLPPAGEPGPAYFAAKDGIVYIDKDGKIGRVKGSERDVVRGVKVAADGHVYALFFGTGSGSDLYRIDGTSMTKVLSLKESLSGDDFDVGKDGKVVGLSLNTFVEYSGKTGTSAPVPGASLLDHVAIDPDGKVWVCGTDKLLSREASGWKEWSLPGDAITHRVVGFATTAAGFRVLSNEQMYKVDGDKLAPVGDTYTVGGADPNRSANGILAIPSWDRHDSEDHLLFTLGDGVTKDVKAHVRHPAVDGSGRAWGFLDGGLVVVHASDGHVVSYPMGSIPELADMGGFVPAYDLAIAGAGPTTLPAPGPQRKAKALKAKIVVGNAPAANVPVEICPEPQTLMSQTPCESSTLRLTTTTNAKGELVIPDVPIGTYGIAFKFAPKWSVDPHPDIEKMREGAVKDLGTLKYDDPGH